MKQKILITRKERFCWKI